MNLKTAIALAGLALALAACGGGGGGGIGDAGASAGAGGTSVPGSAFQSVEAFVAYVRQLIASANDTGEPLALPDGAAPTSETAEPSAV